MFERNAVLGKKQVKEVFGGDPRCNRLIDLLDEKLKAVAVGKLDPENVVRFLDRLPKEVSERLTRPNVKLRGDSPMIVMRREKERKRARTVN